MRLFTASHTPAGFALNAPLSTLRPRCTSAPHLGMGYSLPRGPMHLTADEASTCHGAFHTTTTNGLDAAANDGNYFSAALDNKVRILRRDAGDRSRMVLSGRMADVCAALERMSRAESISCVH